ncbi:MAG: preprotein translocase subunit SecG [Rickettsiales bacterium]|nr:preprotein translocase subunit SecG [Rickettsiales bacterium]
METVLLVIQVIIALALIGIVLIQRSDSDGMGLGGGGGGMGLLSGRAKSNALTRATAILAALFMINSLVLGIITASGHASILDTLDRIDATQSTAPASIEKVVPEVPKAVDNAVSPVTPTETTPTDNAPAQEKNLKTTDAPQTESPKKESAPLSVPRAE